MTATDGVEAPQIEHPEDAYVESPARPPAPPQNRARRLRRDAEMRPRGSIDVRIFRMRDLGNLYTVGCSHEDGLGRVGQSLDRAQTDALGPPVGGHPVCTRP